MDALLEQVKQFADKSHGEQRRRYAQDKYIVHPIRVMETCKKYTEDITVLAAALLHDVLEDTPVTEEELTDFLRSIMNTENAVKTVTMVVELTDIYTKENYPHLNRRVRKDKEARRLSTISEEAQTIKYADIIDNAPEIAEKDADFAKRFLPEYRALLKKINKGHADLYQKAVETIDASMRQLRLQ